MSPDLSLSGRDLLEAMKQYVADLGVADKVVFKPSIDSLALANVLKPGSRSVDRRVVVYYNPEATIRASLIPGICAHELGTHLLRMLNDDKQVWRGAGRKQYRLSPHMATEEGLATLNTLVASNETSLRHSALNYWAVCQGSRMSFADLYKKLEIFMPDPGKRFKLCVRVKRGLTDTSKPGACTLDQNYFLGAVDILKNLDITDLRVLYCGQIARCDVSRLQHLIKSHGLLLPVFLSVYENHLKALRRLRDLNGLGAATSVPRPIKDKQPSK
jgi:hypothetical protein